MILKELYLKKKKRNQVKTLFLIDIFHMKEINACYGFKNGDAILKQLDKLLKTLLKNEINSMLIDTFTIKAPCKLQRHHSDVFAITIYDDLCETAMLKIKEIIVNKLLTEQFIISNYNLQIYINTTIGCSKSADDKLIIYAEKALHNAKQSYEMFVFFDANLYGNEATSNNLIELIKYNIESQKVEPYFQAIYCNKKNTIVKYEALMRLFDQQDNIILPGTFLEKAKCYKLYLPLMQILINKVFDIITSHKINTSINLEFNDIINPLIHDMIIHRIEQQDIGQYLTIEILESEKIQNFDLINEFIQKIKKYNVSIAIDDFGTGFSNYDYILKLNVDYLKIDGSLIQKIDKDIYMNLVKSITMFCRKQKIKIVAEYVSDLKIQRYVQSLGIDYSQGYYIQKPISIAQICGERSEG